MSDNNGYIKAKPWQVVCAPLADGVNNMFFILSMFLSYIAADGYGIAVAVAGYIATGTRMFDAITDPIVAFIGDRINTKFGRIRILMGIGFITMCLAMFGIYFIGVGTNVVVYTLFYMLYIIGYTIYGIGNGSSKPILTNDPVQRAKMYRWVTIYTLVLSALPSVYMSKVLFPKYGSLSTAAFQEMYFTVVIASAILVIIAMCAIASKDKPENFVGKNATSIKIKDCWNVLKSNRAMQMYIVAASSDKLALQAASQSAITTMVFGIIIGNYEFNGSLTMINLIPSFIVVFFATYLSGKNGAKKGLIRWTWISILMAVLMVVFMTVIDPTQISVAAVPTILFLVINALFAACKMSTSAVTGSMLPDIIDYEMYRSGNFMPATVSAIYSFVDKMISSLAATVVGVCISLIGYTSTMPQPGDACTPAIFAMAMFLWMGLPIIGWICTIIAMKFYPLDKEKMEEVQAANAEVRKAAQKAENN